MKNNVKLRITKSALFKGAVIIIACACVIPLLAILIYVIYQGMGKINWAFLSNAEKPIGEVGSGLLHALAGSMMIVALAAVIAIPLGILCGIYLNENKKSRLAYWCSLAVDILQGVPSIIIGIVAHEVLVNVSGHYSAWSAGVALAVMMLPVIIRSTEETLKLLPDTLREAAYALGMPFHRVIMKVIVPCGISGIFSGVVLAIARVAGETAPLLFTAYGADVLTFNVQSQMMTLPQLVYKYANSSAKEWNDLAWGVALVLLIWVFLLNITTKIISRKWKIQL